MKEIDDGIRKPCDQRLVQEVSNSIANRIAEMEAIMIKIEDRVILKREETYYAEKVRKIKLKSAKDPTKLVR